MPDTTSQNSQDDQRLPQVSPVAPSSTGQGNKEVEPKSTAAEVADIEEEKLMAEIRTTAEAADRQALEAIQNSIKEVKAAHAEPNLPPDVEDAGVVSPTKAAEDVIVSGTTIDLPLDEEQYKQAQKLEVSGKTDSKQSVSGVSTLAAFAIWIGRMLKLAHKHTMKVVFRKKE